jgi:hypothetical protein
MRFGITATTKAGDDTALQIGKWTDNAPRMQSFKVGHETLPVIFVDCFVIAR